MNVLRRSNLQRARVQTNGGFSGALAHFADKLAGRVQTVFDVATELTLESVTVGSVITGAPGQPVASGALRDSWHVREIAPGVRSVETSSPYARVVEYDIARMEHAKFRGRNIVRKRKKVVVRGRTYKNHGPYSVMRTRAAFGRIVEEARRIAIARQP